ncbi:hypothetical protein D9M72_582020 [compost metagenome]
MTGVAPHEKFSIRECLDLADVPQMEVRVRMIGQIYVSSVWKDVVGHHDLEAGLDHPRVRPPASRKQ